MAAEGGGETDISTQVKFWEEVVSEWYPNLEKRAYFIPPVHFNRTLYDTVGSGPWNSVLVAKEVADSDTRDDRAAQHVMHCLHALAQSRNEVMAVITQLDFGDYMNEPCYSAAARLFPRPVDFKESKKKKRKNKKNNTTANTNKNNSTSFHEGDFDLLVIHRDYGLLVGEVKSVGANFHQLGLTEEDGDTSIAERLDKALRQLEKADTVLRYLVSDVLPPPAIRVTLILPHVSRARLRNVLEKFPPLQQVFSLRLGVGKGEDPANVCLCSDNLSDPDTPHKVTEQVMNELSKWWNHVLTSRGPDPSFKERYLSVVARFAGPATTVRVFCINKPHLHVHTEGEGVSETASRFVRLVLHPSQLNVLQHGPPGVYLSGLPGTGKTIVLVLKAVQWLEEGHHVNVVSLLKDFSVAAAHMIFHQVRQMGGEFSKGRLHLHVLDGSQENQVKVTMRDLLSRMDDLGRLFVIVDEAVDTTDFIFDTSSTVEEDKTSFAKFLTNIVDAGVTSLHLWAASCNRCNIPSKLTQHVFTESLRLPPALQREVESSGMYKILQCPPYTRSMSIPCPTDGMPVRYVDHVLESDGHTGDKPLYCEQCGRQAAQVLRGDLKVGDTTHRTANTSTSPPPLNYRDVMISVETNHDILDDQLNEEGQVTVPASGFLAGLRLGGLPTRLVKRDNPAALPVMAVMGGPDEAVLAESQLVAGLERKVVVLVDCLVVNRDCKFDFISRCLSQLVWVRNLCKKS